MRFCIFSPLQADVLLLVNRLARLMLMKETHTRARTLHQQSPSPFASLICCQKKPYPTLVATPLRLFLSNSHDVWRQQYTIQSNARPRQVQTSTGYTYHDACRGYCVCIASRHWLRCSDVAGVRFLSWHSFLTRHARDYCRRTAFRQFWRLEIPARVRPTMSRTP